MGEGGNEGTPVTAEVTLTGLSQTYDGSAKSGTVTTEPAGLNVAVPSDDPAYFGGYADANYAAVRDGLGFGADELRTLAANSVSSSFLDDGAKARLLAEVAGWRP